MAQKVQVLLVDDLDGGEATETVSFGLDGTNYEIDLSDDNATALREVMATYVGHGRKVSGGRRARRSSAPASAADGGHSAKEIRDWARSNGHDVPERGRIPSDVRE